MFPFIWDNEVYTGFTQWKASIYWANWAWAYFLIHHHYTNSNYCNYFQEGKKMLKVDKDDFSFTVYVWSMEAVVSFRTTTEGCEKQVILYLRSFPGVCHADDLWHTFKLDLPLVLCDLQSTLDNFVKTATTCVLRNITMHTNLDYAKVIQAKFWKCLIEIKNCFSYYSVWQILKVHLSKTLDLTACLET